MGKIDANDVASEKGAAGLASALDDAEQKAIDPCLRNFRTELVTIQTKEGPKSIIKKQYIPLETVSSTLLSLSSGWPKRVGTMPFHVHDGRVQFLEKTEYFFAWVQERWPLAWGSGMDKKDGYSLVTKAEFYAHLGISARYEQFKAVEELPHWPPIENHFYTWSPPDNYEPDGRYLKDFLGLFDNVETPHDKAILKALLLTPAWGGLYGTRPAFVLEAPDRGCGKSSVSDMIGLLYNGYLDFDLSRSAEEDLASRMLSPVGLTKRVVRVDNVKRQASGGLMEALITSVEISGKQLFHGEASRPNCMVWVITGNGMRMSRDMAERSFIVRLKKLPASSKTGGWREKAMSFVSGPKRQLLLADIVAELKAPLPYEVGCVPDRWAEFVNQVLVRCFDSREELLQAVQLNQLRRDAHDDDLDEAVSVQEAIDDALRTKPDAVLDDPIFLTCPDMTEVVNDCLNTKFKMRQITHLLNQHIEAGRIGRIKKHRTATRKGWHCWLCDDDRQALIEARGCQEPPIWNPE